MKLRNTFAIVIATACAGYLSSSAMAFDGQRKGFVLGGGIGVSPSAGIHSDAVLFSLPGGGTIVDEFDESKAGPAANLMIGYAWDEFNMLVFEVNAASFTSDILLDDGGNEAEVSLGFVGASWYHYFGPAGHTPFINLGLGSFAFQIEDNDNIDPGFGGQGGVGYEFARHFQVGGYVSFGQSSDGTNDFTHTMVNFIVSGVVF